MKSNKAPILSVALRGGFSDRNGIKSENKIIQYDSLDKRTRTAIMNGINALYHNVYKYDNDGKNALWIDVLSQVYQQPVDYSGNSYYIEKKMFEIINNTIANYDYDIVLTILEFMANKFEKENIYNRYSGCSVKEYINDILEKEYVGYRYINGIIISITDNNEINSIEEALTVPFQKTTKHLNKALTLISDRNHPDYANSIKESISSVEAICSEILGKSDTLGAALKKMEQKNITIHPSLKTAFEKLYGYTSDASGIRHTGQLDGKDATFEEAKFMLISCSAFINYLKGITSSIN
ncbi:AbiJ-NTD4 domain-containing protein [Anaerofustis sp. NSJ-163]|nr:hypothetical protein [Anaerofustis sp. NSJ-163]MCO8193670.1 hypothetical protein [Anaerofustis sp. NSJ-163]